MPQIRNCLISLVIVSAVAAISSVSTVSLAESGNQSLTEKASSAAKDVSKWTRKEWNAARAKWVKDREKWNGCTKEATDKKLRGRKSWSFIYDCVTS
jgi:hypothetical protein